MGALCSKSTSDPFAQPGRTLASAPAPAKTTSSVPASAGRKLGGSSAGASSQKPAGAAAGTSAEQAEKREKLAKAAEARAKISDKGGKLTQQLDKQKKQTRIQNLTTAATEEVQHRRVDEARKDLVHE